MNASQSTNDVDPTALRLVAWIGIGELLRETAALRHAFEARAAECADVLKIGRTELQDAEPMTLGQEFMAFAVMIGEDEQRLNEARALPSGWRASCRRPATICGCCRPDRRPVSATWCCRRARTA